MDVSVSLCTYNGMPYVKTQLDSILRQSRPPDEIVICDDRSTDGTLDEIERYRQEHPELFQVYQNENRLGPTKNIEQCIRRCSGDVIALCDQDDIWMKTKIETQLDALQDDGVKFVFHNATLVTESGEPITDLWSTISRGPALGNPTEVFTSLLRRNFVQGATTLFDASLREELLPFHGLFEYDRYMPILATLLGVQRGIDQELSQWRQHDSQAIGAPNTSIFQKILDGFHNPEENFETDMDMWPILREKVSQFDSEMLAVDKNYALDLLECREKYTSTRQTIYDDQTPRIQRMRYLLENVQQKRYGKFGTGTAGMLSILRDLPETII